MINLMEWHFAAQRGMYFDRRTEAQSYVVYSSDLIRDEYWNYAYLKDGACTEDILISIEQSFADLQRLPCIYLLSDESYEHLRGFLKQRGYSLFRKEAVMLYAGKIKKINHRKAPSLFCVTDSKTARDFIKVYTAAFFEEVTLSREPDKAYVDALSRTLGDSPQFFHYVCYDERTPVSVATLCVCDGKAGIYNVGTVPFAQGKGFATATISACIAKSGELNCDDLFLQTDAVGSVENLYRRLGFRVKFIGRCFRASV